MAQMDWNDIRVFLALFREKSVRKAADALGMSHSTASRHLNDLETSLGEILFTRSRDGLLPTRMGEQIFARSESVETEVPGLEREATNLDSVLTGEVRVTAAPGLTQGLIMPHLAAFSEKYPGVELIIHSSNSILDLMRGSSDVAIRSQANPDDNLVGRRLPNFTDYAYATPKYIDDHWFEGDKTNAAWLGRGQGKGNNRWIKTSPFPDAIVRHSLPDPLDQVHAAAAGLGMAALPCFYADQFAGLARIPGTGPVAERPAWVLTHPDLRTSVRIRTFVRFLVSEMAKQEAQISGKLR